MIVGKMKICDHCVALAHSFLLTNKSGQDSHPLSGYGKHFSFVALYPPIMTYFAMN